MHALEECNVECVKVLIRQGADINHRCQLGATPLKLAVDRGDIECVNLLIENGAEVNGSSDCLDIMTVLMHGIMRNDQDIVLSLINAGANINEVTGEDNVNALMLAVTFGYFECVKILVEHGAFLNEENVGGRTVLSKAAERGNVRCVQLLIENGALLDIGDSCGTTALMYAVANNHVNCVKILLDAGTRLDLTDKWKNDALLISLRSNDESCTLGLLEAGCPLNNVNSVGDTPLVVAIKNNKVAMVDELIRRGVYVNQCVNNKTALWYAANNCFEDFVPVLLAAEADPNIGRPALIIAARFARVKCVKMLLDSGANVNAFDLHYGNIIDVGGYVGSYKIVKFALDAGADLLDIWKKYRSPMVYNEKCLKLLFAAGQEFGRFSSANTPKDILAERKTFSLLNLCRQEIRQCLSLARPKRNILRLIKLLCLPKALTNYLSYDIVY